MIPYTHLIKTSSVFIDSIVYIYLVYIISCCDPYYTWGETSQQYVCMFFNFNAMLYFCHTVWLETSRFKRRLRMTASFKEKLRSQQAIFQEFIVIDWLAFFFLSSVSLKIVGRATFDSCKAIEYYDDCDDHMNEWMDEKHY